MCVHESTRVLKCLLISLVKGNIRQAKLHLQKHVYKRKRHFVMAFLRDCHYLPRASSVCVKPHCILTLRQQRHVDQNHSSCGYHVNSSCTRTASLNDVNGGDIQKAAASSFTGLCCFLEESIILWLAISPKAKDWRNFSLHYVITLFKQISENEVSSVLHFGLHLFLLPEPVSCNVRPCTLNLSHMQISCCKGQQMNSAPCS
jgi:hypothetical protein